MSPRRLLRSPAFERGAWVALLALSLALHLWGLGERSFHHDESIHGKLSWDLATRGAYHYDPTYHGPLLYYLTALVFLVADTDFTARLPIASAGVAMLWVAWRLRRPFGPAAAWWTGLLVTISPLYLFFGRFLRQDLLELLAASAALLAFYPLARDRGLPRRSDRFSDSEPPLPFWRWVSVGVWTGLAFAITEVAYVSVALLAFTGLVLAAANGPRRTLPLAAAWTRRNLEGLGLSLAVFVLVTVPLYTVAFTRPADWCFPYPALTYWWGQHQLERVGGPWWFHLPRLAQYELLALGAALAWGARRWRRLWPVEQFLLVFGCASVALYCHLGEKVPWLAVHQVWAFLPLAGAQLARTFGRRGRWWSRGLAGAGLAATAAVSLVASFGLDEITPNQERVESLQFVQTCPEVKGLVAEGLARGAGGGPAATVSGEGAWPLSWYWREVPVLWGAPAAGSRPGLVVCDPGAEADLVRLLGPGYRVERVPLRAWWLMERWPPGTLSLLDWLRGGPTLERLRATRPWAAGRYLLTRRPWSEIGSTDVMVLRDVGQASGAGARVATVPEVLRQELGATSALVLGEGWLGEPRGVAIGHAWVAVADAGLSLVRLLDRDGQLHERDGRALLQPEAVAWTGDGSLVVADTWNHRLLLEDPVTGTDAVLAEPTGRWYGPRAVAVAPDGRLAAADTGNRRVVLYGPVLDTPRLLDAADVGGLAEPGGLAFVDNRTLLVCDTGNRRLLLVATDGGPTTVVPLPGAWGDYYSRPQAAVLAPSTWLVSDTPARALWLVRDGVPRRLDLAPAGITPTGLAWDPDRRTLALGDLTGAVWLLELEDPR